jgi:hypothetical protein
MKFGMFKDGRSVSKDKIDSPFYIRVEIILAPIVGEKRILVTQKAAVLEDSSIGANSYSYGLPCVASRILKCQIIRFETDAVDLRSFSKECASCLRSIEAVRYHNILWRLPHSKEDYVRMILSNDNAFMVDPGGDLNENAPLFAIGTDPSKRVMVQCHLYGRKSRRTLNTSFNIRGNVDMNILALTRKRAQKRYKEQKS